MRIFVGNLPFTCSKNDVQKLFEAFGRVTSVSLTHKSGKNSRSFGFVDMPDENEAPVAMAALEGQDFKGHILKVTSEHVKFKEPISEAIVPVPVPELKEIPEIKEKKFHSNRRKAGSWEKRKGTGKAKGWKKKPGGVRKKFKE